MRLVRWLFAGALILSAQAAGSPARAEIRALLVGANIYNIPGVMDLQGPLNDMNSVEALLRQRGATDITVIKNEQVTRSHVETAFHALGQRSKPGDWVVLFYAGHGAQAEAQVKGVKKNDLDDFLVLPGIKPDKPDPETYIMSADLRSWLLSYVPADVTVVQIVDACHSGTLQRKIDLAARHPRARVAFQNRGAEGALTLTTRPGPHFDTLPNSIRAKLGAADPEYLPNVIYISAAQDEQFASEDELPVAGSPVHGFLTYNFLAAMTAPGITLDKVAADTNHDGVVSLGEMAVYLDSQVRSMSDEEQKPAIHFSSEFQDRALFTQPAFPSAQPVQPKPAIYVAAAGGATTRPASG